MIGSGGAVQTLEARIAVLSENFKKTMKPVKLAAADVAKRNTHTKEEAKLPMAGWKRDDEI